MPDLTIPEAKKILNAYSCSETQGIESETEKKQLQQALLLFSQESDAENLGICADNAEQGFLALESYLKAMGYKAAFGEIDLTDAPAPIYIKYNTQKLSCYQDKYIGDYRGVLVSCQSEDDNINGVYGHFPLDLFS